MKTGTEVLLTVLLGLLRAKNLFPRMPQSVKRSHFKKAGLGFHFWTGYHVNPPCLQFCGRREAMATRIAPETLKSV